MLAVIGILGGVLSLLSNIPYVINTIQKKTKPQRVTWGIFFILNSIFLCNQMAIGATNSLWLIASFTVSTFAIFCLSIFYGVGGYTKRDLGILAGSLVGVALWLGLDQPVFSVIMSLIVAILASIPTFIKAYKDPASETAIKWLLGGVAAFLTIVSVSKIDLVILLPLLSFMTQIGIYITISVRSKRLA